VFTFYRTVPVLPYDEVAASHFARLRHVLQQRPGTQDLRIAAIALSRGATLVTRNQRDLQGIAGLPLED
jgi:tRNA(fMet)-specific endonuclease VapC